MRTPRDGHQGNSGTGISIGWNTLGRRMCMYKVARNHTAARAEASSSYISTKADQVTAAHFERFGCFCPAGTFARAYS